jgi:hypothetical protein
MFMGLGAKLPVFLILDGMHLLCHPLTMTLCSHDPGGIEILETIVGIRIMVYLLMDQMLGSLIILPLC